jgi:hypothetical protein
VRGAAVAPGALRAAAAPSPRDQAPLPALLPGDQTVQLHGTPPALPAAGPAGWHAFLRCCRRPPCALPPSPPRLWVRPPGFLLAAHLPSSPPRPPSCCLCEPR